MALSTILSSYPLLLPSFEMFLELAEDCLNVLFPTETIIYHLFSALNLSIYHFLLQRDASKIEAEGSFVN